MVTRNQVIGAAFAAVVVTAVVVIAVVYYSIHLRGHGIIKVIGLEAYADPNATTMVSEIDWGVVAPGSRSIATLYLKSTSNFQSNLTLVTENWDPAHAVNYLTISWDYDGSYLQPGEIRRTDLILDVKLNVKNVTVFSSDIVITARG